MEYVSVVIYQGAKAYYRIFCEEGNTYKAYLESYQGRKDHTPPKTLLFFREGNSLVADSDSLDLARDISGNIDLMNTPLDDVLNKKGKKKPE